MERKNTQFSIKDLESIFEQTMADFTRIDMNEIKELEVNSNEEYENIQDVVIYTNNDCSIACGILIEQFNGKLQLTITRFDELVLLDEVAPVVNISQLNNPNWGYEGLNDIAMIEDVNDILGAKKLLKEFLLNHSK